MKAIIDIITEKIDTGNHQVNMAHYKGHTEQNLPLAIWQGEVPDVGETLTNGQQEMKVVDHIVIEDNVGLVMDSGITVTAPQVVEMMTSGAIWIK